MIDLARYLVGEITNVTGDLTGLTCGTRDSQHSDPAWQPTRDDSTSGSRWSARSVVRTNDLEADVGRRDDETVPERSDLQRFIAVSSGFRARTRVRTPRLTSVHGALSGDMMVDGVIPTRRSCGRSFFGGCPGQRPGEHSGCWSRPQIITLIAGGTRTGASAFQAASAQASSPAARRAW